jgi:signal peptidase I
MEIKKILKKTWHFIWHSNSVWSWIVNIILAFVIIKFLLYPGLGLVMGTSHPIVAVVSGSMEHNGNFDEWWQSSALCGDNSCTQAEFYLQFGINKEDFLDYRFKNGFNMGDIIFLRGVDDEKIKEGDVLVFWAKRPDPIIHRVIDVVQEDNESYFQTKGDHNLQPISSFDLDEARVGSEQVVGKALFRVPYLGWIKIGFVKLIGLFIR